MPLTSDSLGPLIAEAIGLPTEYLSGFTLRFQAGQLVRCDAEYLVPAECTSTITQIIGKSYELCER